MTTSSIRRQMKNIVNNYSEAEIKVREATSNDPWGPSSSLMTEVADLTYNVVAFSEIMSMIWKRLNDHGKNWRHVYKALTLLDYLIKTGSERVSHQCKENIFAIQTLKDFQYIDRDGKDQGINVREKSKQLVSLLKDDERLKGERAQALKTKERMAQVATGVGSSNQISFGRGSSQPNLSTSYSEQDYGKSGGSPASYHGFMCDVLSATSPRASSELEQARPQTSGEEELQLQLALAMSREVAEQEERIRRGDDLRLQMALEESRKDNIKAPKKKPQPQTSLLDLMDALPSGAPTPQKSEPWAAVSATASSNQQDPWGGSAARSTGINTWQSFAGTKPSVNSDPWGSSSASASQPLPKKQDPWAPPQAAGTANSTADPWGPAPGVKTSTSTGGSSFDPFSNLNGTAKDDFSEFDSLRSSSKVSADSISTLPSLRSGTTSPDLFDSQTTITTSIGKQTIARKTPESFLGPNAALVNLETLVTMPAQPAPTFNPFLASGTSTQGSAPVVNPFQVNQPQALTLNQLRSSPMMGVSPSFNTVPAMAPEVSVPPPLLGMSTLPAIPPTGLGINMNMAATLPHHSSAIPPSTAQAMNVTNPFLL
ncbi:epsin-2 isoform X1 [Bufo bufo]|uniref:epsin-2 isoform X1 n=1 Tax=Bufo bufo TaxID=8384 RepID=UPI001ABE62AC|nr:epsin-2 isoform X1 [Bufo bufo]XP_040295398.1 epsin-2 isoform X1 [Bufo bufo]XP_040295399.1 epsin-2 isoform X1 [Bufo bufo]